MSDPYVGEIRMFAGDYAPQGWALCDGSTLSINGNEALYSLIGVIYGGDGQTNFKLPDLRGRVPIHLNSQHPLGQSAGTEQVTLLESQLPIHTHAVNAGKANPQNSPQNNFWGNSGAVTNYIANGTPNQSMNNTLVSTVGGNQSHDNMMPYLTTNFIIAKIGLYPTQD